MENFIFGATNYSLIDIFSLRHFFSGLVIGLILVWLHNKHNAYQGNWIYYLVGMVPIVLWEILEIFLRFVKFELNANRLYGFTSIFVPQSTFTLEGKINIYADIVLGLMGLGIIYYIYLKKHESN